MIKKYVRFKEYQCEQWDGQAETICGYSIVTRNNESWVMIKRSPYSEIKQGDWGVINDKGEFAVYPDEEFQDSGFCPIPKRLRNR